MRRALAVLGFALVAIGGPVTAGADTFIFIGNPPAVPLQSLNPLELVTDSGTTEPRTRAQVIKGLPSIIVEGTYGPYTISRCPGCTAPARLVLDDGPPAASGVYRLILTDATIRVSPQATAAQVAAGLDIFLFTTFDRSKTTGQYPHGVTMDGTFACRGARCALPTGARIVVTAFGGDEEAFEGQTLIKQGANPNTEPSLRFAVSTTRSFARQAIREVGCAGACSPLGSLKVTIQFTAAGDAVHLPGSIGLLGATVTGEAGLVVLQQAMNELLAAGAVGGECGGPVPCACGDTVTASRRFDRDPVVQQVCPGDGLIVRGSDIELAFKGGHTVRGSGVGTGILLGPGVTGVTVKSGGVTGFETGVRVSGNDGNTFTAIRVLGNVDAGLDVMGNGNTIDNVRSAANAAGIVVEGDGNTLTGNRSERDGTGLAVTGAGNTVSRTLVEGSAGVGIAVDGTGALVERNQVSGSGDDGLVVTGRGHRVSRNVLRFNAGDGLAVSASAGTTVERTRTDRNGGFGILELPAPDPAGAPNSYSVNVCAGDGLGLASPAGLCR